MPKSDNVTPHSKRLGTAPEAEVTGNSFRLLIERVKDYAIFLLDIHGNVLSWNEGLLRIKGYKAEEVIGKHISMFYTPQDIRADLPGRLLQIAKTAGQVENEGWRVRKDGTRFWGDVLITALYDDDRKLRGFGKVTRDLTERKAAQDTLSELAGRLIDFQDVERRRIGRELHDTTSPLLTSLTGKLYLARQRARATSPEMVTLVDEALVLAEATSTMVRTFSSMLHPQMLEQSGLLVTLRWYLDAFASRSGARVTAILPEAMARLTQDKEIVLFRATQEWLRAAQHVGAATMRVHLTAAVDQVILFIESQDGDWSRDFEDLQAGRGEFGAVFAGMKARVRQFGGTFEMVPAGPGLVLRVRMPTKSRESSR
jgi:PAS domain S-box-containing protein